MDSGMSMEVEVEWDGEEVVRRSSNEEAQGQGVVESPTNPQEEPVMIPDDGFPSPPLSSHSTVCCTAHYGDHVVDGNGERGKVSGTGDHADGGGGAVEEGSAVAPEKGKPEDPFDCFGDRPQFKQVPLGRRYHQVEIPDFIPDKKQALNDPKKYPDLGIAMWKPTPDLTAEQVSDYLDKAKRDFGYAEDGALAMLQWHKYDLDKAFNDMPNFCPSPLQELDELDQEMFHTVFRELRNDFKKIKRLFGDTRPMKNLVYLYYRFWKVKEYKIMWEKKARQDAAAAAARKRKEELARGGNKARRGRRRRF